MSARSSFPCPAIRTSGMNAIRSMADGRTHSDRNEYEAALRVDNLRIVEGNNDSPPPEKPMVDVGAILNRELEKRGF